MQQNNMNNLPRNLSVLAKDAGLSEHELTGKAKMRAKRQRKERCGAITRMKSVLLWWVSRSNNW